MTSKKIDDLFIRKDGENDETPPYAVVYFSVLSILSSKTWAIQDMIIWLSHPNNIPYYRWNIIANTILDYWISVEGLDMSEDIYITLPQGESGKD